MRGMSMAKFNTLDYFSPNLRGNELYKFFSQVLDHGLETVVFPEMDKNTAIYDPSKPSYDPIYILELLGQPDLADLITTEVDQNSVSVLLPSILDNKGMKDGVDLIFKLINVEIDEILYQKTPEGCSLATILLPKNVILSTRQIKLIDRLSRKVFPICVRLTGIANCLPDGVESLGSASLDTSWLLDTSILDGSVGIRVPDISDTLWLRFCLDIMSEMEVPLEVLIDRFSDRLINSYLTVFDRRTIRLDNGLILDMGTYYDLQNTDTTHSRLYSSLAEFNVDLSTDSRTTEIESLLDLSDLVAGLEFKSSMLREIFLFLDIDLSEFGFGNYMDRKIDHLSKGIEQVNYGYEGGNYADGYDLTNYQSFEYENLYVIQPHRDGQTQRSGVADYGLPEIDWLHFEGMDFINGSYLLDGTRYLHQEFIKKIKVYDWYTHWSSYREAMFLTTHKTERLLEKRDGTILHDGTYNRGEKVTRYGFEPLYNDVISHDDTYYRDANL